METHLAGIVITTHHLRQKPPRKDNRRAFELTESTVDKGFTHSSQDKFVYLSLYLLSFCFRQDALGLQALSSGMKRGASCTAAPASIQHRAKQLAVEASLSKKSTRGKNSLLVDKPIVLVECVCENGYITPSSRANGMLNQVEISGKHNGKEFQICFHPSRRHNRRQLVSI